MLAPGNCFLQRLLQLLNRGAGENRALIAEQIVGMHFLGEHQLHAVKVAGTQGKCAARLLATLYQQGGALGIELVEGCPIRLGLGVRHLQAFDHGQLAIGQLGGQRGAQGAEQLLAGEGVIVATRLRSVHRAAVTPDRRTHRANAGAAGTLLLPQLLARTRDQLLVLGGGSTLPHRSPIVLHCFPQQGLVDLFWREDLVRQLQRAYCFSTEIDYINVCHLFSSRTAHRANCPQGLQPSNAQVLDVWAKAHTYQPKPTYFFPLPPEGLPPEAFFEAFNGSTVPPPPKPRRSRGGALDLEIITYPSRGPGMAPSTINRFSSKSMPRMRRFRTVICLAPKCPGIR